MFLIEILVTLLVAGVFTALLVGAAGWRYPRSEGAVMAGLFVFLVLFLGLWAASRWFVPVPAAWTLAYVLYVAFFGLFLVLLFAALAPPARRRPGTEPSEPGPETTALGPFFWLLLAFLLIAVLLA
jgi:hypothetical protein